jgi:hypothetical protein
VEGNSGGSALGVVGGEGVVGELPRGVRRLGVGSIGVEEDRRGVPHGEQEAAAGGARR